MRGYERDEYEDYGEYEDDGYGQEVEEGEGEEEEEYEEEEEEEEERKPSAEELEYLQLRARIKERIRRKMQRENGAAVSKSQDTRKKVSSDNYGSFFGPSRPVIAQRVIQESKTLLENPHLALRTLSSHHEKKTSSSNGAGSKNGAREQIPKIRNELKTRVQKIKDTRDYSFLLSDDAELPATKQPVPQNISAPKTEARTAQLPQKSRQQSGNSVRDIHGGREERKSGPMNGQMHYKSGLMNGQMHSKSGPNRSTSTSKPTSTSMDSRKQLGSNNGIGPGRPIGPKGLSPKPSVTTMERKASAPAPKSIMPATCKPLPPKMQASVPRQHVEQKRTFQEPKKAVPKQPVPMPRQPLASSRPQMDKPVKNISSLQDSRPKKKPSKRLADEDAEALFELRKMLGPQRWSAVDDDDLSDMEANFEDIQKEEKRSLRIAKKEDEEQLRLIQEEEEEERRNRMRKLAKKRKLSHH